MQNDFKSQLSYSKTDHDSYPLEESSGKVIKFRLLRFSFKYVNGDTKRGPLNTMHSLCKQ